MMKDANTLEALFAVLKPFVARQADQCPKADICSRYSRCPAAREITTVMLWLSGMAGGVPNLPHALGADSSAITAPGMENAQTRMSHFSEIGAWWSAQGSTKHRGKGARAAIAAFQGNIENASAIGQQLKSVEHSRLLSPVAEAHACFPFEEPHEGRATYVQHGGGVFDGDHLRQILAHLRAQSGQIGPPRHRQIERLRRLERQLHQKQPDDGICSLTTCRRYGEVGKLQDQFPKKRCDLHHHALFGKPLDSARLDQQ